jgi:hypothetical protein
MFGDKNIHTRYLDLMAALEFKSSIFNNVLTLNNYVAKHRLFRYSHNYNNVFD